MADKIDLILEIVENIKKDNDSAHTEIKESIKNMRGDVNGLKEYKNKLLGIASFVSFIVSVFFIFVYEKIRGK